jgi:hypothetical protein
MDLNNKCESKGGATHIESSGNNARSWLSPLPMSPSLAPNAAPYTPPTPADVHLCAPPTRVQANAVLKVINSILNPRQLKGYSHKRAEHNPILQIRLEAMASLLRLYQRVLYKGWVVVLELFARAAGKGPRLAQHLRKWVRVMINNSQGLLTHYYGKHSASALDHKDIRKEIILHLQSLGPYLLARDMVQFVATPQMRAQLELLWPIPKSTARPWLRRIGFCFMKDPKGQ